eukprot:PLAT13825.1.p1 GENE.PLAT13825.1~~PLAT13825.1.p1  ORF type:complete len:319 (+),score=61.94 PLAT13825.1:46-957(+)
MSRKLVALLALAAVAQAVDGSNSGISASQMSTLRAITLVTASLSICGSLFIIFTFFKFPSLQTVPFRLIMLLSVADFGSSITYIIGASSDAPAVCTISGFMSQFFDLATFLWVGCIAVNLYFVFLRGGLATKRNLAAFHAVAWGLPLVLAIITVAIGAIGPAGLWCWITADFQALRWLFFYVPLWVIMAAIAVVYTRVIGKFGEKSTSKKDSRAVTSRLRLYVLVFLFLRLWSTANRIQNAVAPNSPVFFLLAMHSLFSPLQGFLNALVYGLNKKVLALYRSKLCSSEEKEMDGIEAGETSRK